MPPQNHSHGARAPRLPRSPFNLNIRLEARPGDGASRVEVKVEGDGGEPGGKYRFSAPNRAQLEKWVVEGAQLLGEAMHAEVQHGPRSQQAARLHEGLQAVGGERFEKFFRPAGADPRVQQQLVRKLLTSDLLRYVAFEADHDVPGLTIDMFHLGSGEFAPADASGFVGMVAPVVHTPAGSKEARDRYGESSIGVLSRKGADPLRAARATSCFEDLLSGGRIGALHRHTPLLDTSGKELKRGDREALWRLMETEHRAVWHLLSHMDSVGGHNRFILDNAAEILVTSFERPECPMFDGEPLVFLNLCSAGSPSRVGDPSFAQLLLDKGAFGVIAPNLLVDEDFAIDFADSFYRALLSGTVGRTVGRALVLARRAAFQDNGSLLGTGYSLHALHDFCLFEASGPAQMALAA